MDRTIEINQLHAELCGAAGDFAVKAIRLGELLTEEKKHCKHGQWLPWLKANTVIAQQTANQYMNCYLNRDRLKSLSSSDLTLVGLARKSSSPSKPPARHTQAKEVISHVAAGQSRTEAATATGVSERTVRREVETETVFQNGVAQGEENARAQAAKDVLSMSQKEKLERVIEREKKRLYEEFDQMKFKWLRENTDSYLERILPQLKAEQEDAQRIMNRREGLMTKETFRLIRTCLHSDQITDPKQKRRYDNAFIEFNKLEKFVLSEADSPTKLTRIPSTLEELKAHKRSEDARKRAGKGAAII